MSVVFTEAWLKEYQQRTGKKAHDVTRTGADENKKPKYGNRRTEADGTVFDSKHEATVYEELKTQGLAHEIKGFGKQVTFFLPGGVKYIADFVVILNDGSTMVIDAKSEATRKDKVYRLKKRMMRECLGVEIIER